MLSQSWIVSTGGAATFSGGQYPPNYGTPSARTWFSAGQDSPDEPYPEFSAFFASGGGRTSFRIEANDAESRKRVLTCLAAFLMPREGVDENFAATVECLRYYCEAQSLPALPPKPDPTKVTGSISRFMTRPDLVLTED